MGKTNLITANFYSSFVNKLLSGRRKERMSVVYMYNSTRAQYNSGNSRWPAGIAHMDRELPSQNKAGITQLV
jgi:hypothetical protein